MTSDTQSTTSPLGDTFAASNMHYRQSMSNPTPADMAYSADLAALEQEGPKPLPVPPQVFTCTGCKHLKTEEWDFEGDNDDRDSGTDAECMVADKHIDSYWRKNQKSPEWCPLSALANQRPGQDKIAKAAGSSAAEIVERCARIAERTSAVCGAHVGDLRIRIAAAIRASSPAGEVK